MHILGVHCAPCCPNLSNTQIGGKVPGIPTAENYITAFYLPVDTDLVEWFKEHPEYLLRHVLALTKVNPTAASAKRAHVQQALEDIDRARRGKQHM